MSEIERNQMLLLLRLRRTSCERGLVAGENRTLVSLRCFVEEWTARKKGQRGYEDEDASSILPGSSQKNRFVVMFWESPYYRTPPLDQNQHGNYQPRAARPDTTTTTTAARRQTAPPLVRFRRRLECHSDSALLSNTIQREGINPQVMPCRYRIQHL